MSIHLYDLLDTSTKKRVDLGANKPGTLRAARALRKAYNRSVNDPLRYIVVPGPQHPKFKE